MNRHSDPPALLANPHECVNYVVGMSLEVPDLEDEQAYHRGKQRLHNAWLHGGGTIWGLGVTFDEQTREVRVSPGLALDRLGREMFLPAPFCRRLADFCDEHAAVLRTQSDSGASFDAHVVASFGASFEGDVPILGSENAPLRIRETMRLALLPGPAPALDRGFPRVHALFRALGTKLELPEVEAWREKIRAVRSRGKRMVLYREALAVLGALDALEMAPAAHAAGHGGRSTSASLFQRGEGSIVLAELHGVTRSSDAGFEVDEVRYGPRPVALPTTLLQDLLCEVMVATAPRKDAGGPRVTKALVSRGRILLHFDQPILEATLEPGGVQVMLLDRRSGWRPADLREVRLATKEDYKLDVYRRDVMVVTPTGIVEVHEVEIQEVWRAVIAEPKDRRRIHLAFACPDDVIAIRLIAKGTGPNPLLNEDLVPLAGGIHDGAGGPMSGSDFVLQRQLA